MPYEFKVSDSMIVLQAENSEIQVPKWRCENKRNNCLLQLQILLQTAFRDILKKSAGKVCIISLLGESLISFLPDENIPETYTHTYHEEILAMSLSFEVPLSTIQKLLVTVKNDMSAQIRIDGARTSILNITLLQLQIKAIAGAVAEHIIEYPGSI